MEIYNCTTTATTNVCNFGSDIELFFYFFIAMIAISTFIKLVDFVKNVVIHLNS